MNCSKLYRFTLKKDPDKTFISTGEEANPFFTQRMNTILKNYDGRILYFYEGYGRNTYYYASEDNGGYKFNIRKTTRVNFLWAKRWLIPVIDDIEAII